jgi:hypothetical protein
LSASRRDANDLCRPVANFAAELPQWHMPENDDSSGAAKSWLWVAGGLFWIVVLFLFLSLTFCSDPMRVFRDPRDNVEVDGKTVDQYFSDEKVIRLARAACRGDVSSVEDLLKQGIGPDSLSDDRSMSVLGWAMNCLSPEGMESLLKGGADPNMRLIQRTPDGDYSFTAVTKAAYSFDPRLLKVLLQYGGDPNARLSGERASSSALSFALLVGTHGQGWENYYALISDGASIGLRDSRTAETIAEEAAEVRQYEKVEELLEKGYNSRLDYLAKIIQDDDVRYMREQDRAWMKRVRATLIARGVKLPVPQSTDLSLEHEALAAELQERRNKPGGLLFNP